MEALEPPLSGQGAQDNGAGAAGAVTEVLAAPAALAAPVAKARQPQNINRNGPKQGVFLKLFIVITSKSNIAETVDTSPHMTDSTYGKARQPET